MCAILSPCPRHCPAYGRADDRRTCPGFCGRLLVWRCLPERGGALAGYRRTADRKAGDEQAKTEICQERGGGPQRDAAAAGNRRRSGRAGGIPSGKRRRMGGAGPLRHPGFARRKGGFFGERTAAQISRRAMRILHERYTTAGKSITLEKQNDRK